MRTGTRWLVFVLMIAGGLGFSATGPYAQVTDGSKYSYYYRGRLVTLHPSEALVALPESEAQAAGVGGFGALSRDARSSHAALKSYDLGLYRTLAGAGKGARGGARSVLSAASRNPRSGAQPVFEQGGLLVIPVDEVIIRFKKATTLEDARRFVRTAGARQGLLGARALREDTFILKIAQPTDGRAFRVSQFLARQPGVEYSEPNFVLLHSQAATTGWKPTPFTVAPDEQETPIAGPAARSGFRSITAQSAPNWTTLLAESFEGALTGWTGGHQPNPANNADVNAVPAVATNHAHTGTHGIWMSGGGTQGAVNPYPDNCNAFLDSPTLNLTGAEEAYVEVWFYEKVENPGNSIFDYGLIGGYDPNTGTGQFFDVLAVSYTGDLTADPTTQAGWRRALARIPPGLHGSFRLRIGFRSDVSNGAEGLFIDDVRVVSTTDVDTEPLGNDQYGAREYELKNAGQIAALGTDANDLNVPEAWAAQGVSPNIIVGVSDEGVDLTHPDLNLVPGFSADTGAVGGGPLSDAASHGTAVAGNIGAVRNNAIGTIGTAPGVKIMPLSWGTNAGAAAAFDLARTHGVRVVNNSWGGVGFFSSVIQDAIKAALNANVVVLFAAGNGPDRQPFTYQVAWPGSLTGDADPVLRNIICVGATSPTDEHKAAASSDGLFSWGSSYVGAGPDVCAPGPWSYTTDRQGDLGYNSANSGSGVDAAYTLDFGGTSSATPKVSGIVALLLSKNPNLTPAQVKQILMNTARDIDAPGSDDKTGAGRVDAIAALNAVPATASIQVTAPDGGENWAVGTQHNITWTSTGIPGNVKIELSRNNGGSWETISASVPNTGTFAWTVSGQTTTQARVRISDVANAAINDGSSNTFIIGESATLTVTSPNGGELWLIGSHQTIQWTSSGVAGNVKIELSRNNGGSWETLAASAANTGSFGVDVAGATTLFALVRVSAVTGGSSSDTSDDTFSILPPPTFVTVQQPNGGESVAVGSAQNITWVSGNVAGNVKIELSRDGGGSWETIAASAPNNGTFAWTVTGPPTTQARVRVSQASDASMNDASDASFTITGHLVGDTNDDGSITDDDVNTIVGVYLLVVPFNPALHDVDNNGRLDIGDVQATINARLAAGGASITLSPVRGVAPTGGGINGLAAAKSFKLNYNSGTLQLTAIAFDFQLGRAQLKKVIVPGRSDLQGFFAKGSNGKVRTILFSTVGVPITSARPLFTVQATGLNAVKPIRPDSGGSGADGCGTNAISTPVPYSKGAKKKPSIG